jgi:acetyl esterase/lipase
MKRIYVFLFFSLFSLLNINAQQVIKLWEKPPTSNGFSGDMIVPEDKGWIQNVSSAELEVFLPEKAKANGAAVVICPGGGYAGLAYNHEGLMAAKWFNNEGIAAFILKYRMPNKHSEIPLDDAHQAMRYVRDNADKFGVDKSKIGICGFSAGGHLASTAATHFASSGTSTRPDFAILFYPVITMNEFTHGGSKSNLLGDNPSKADIYRFSNENQVNVNTPPAILLLSDDDKAVAPDNSISFYLALKQNDIPASMYIFPTGGHGWGFRDSFEYYNQMSYLLSAWIKNTIK